MPVTVLTREPPYKIQQYPFCVVGTYPKWGMPRDVSCSMSMLAGHEGAGVRSNTTAEPTVVVFASALAAVLAPLVGSGSRVGVVESRSDLCPQPLGGRIPFAVRLSRYLLGVKMNTAALSLRREEDVKCLNDFNNMLVLERPDLVMADGVVRLYRLPNGYGLNGINSPHAYSFPYAWEFSVLEPSSEDVLGFGDVVFDTPLTSTVKVCRTEAEAVAFLEFAIAWASKARL